MVNKKTIIGLAIVASVSVMAVGLQKFISTPSGSAILPRCSSVEMVTNTPNDDLDPHWSPDGKQIAFVGHHEGNPEVYMMDVATRALTNLSHSKYDDYNPIWSPDGRYIAYFHRQKPNSKDAIQLRVIEVATGYIRAVTPDYIPIYAMDVHWSPDSKQLQFISYPDWFSYDPVTRHLHNEGEVVQTKAPILGVQSRDGQVATVANSTTSDGLPMKLLLAGNPSSQPRELLQLNIGFTPASWSPTRDQLAFYSYAGVYVLDIPTGNYRDFIQGLGKIMTVHWSPDGNYVSALFGTASARKVAVADIRSGSICGYGSDNLPHRYIQQPIRYNYIYSDPEWSPTGDQVVFSSGFNGNANLVLLTMPD